MIRFPFFPRPLTPLQKAERASTLAVSTQAVRHVRARRRRAVINGLLAKLPDEDQARIGAKLDEAERAR